MSNLKVIDGSKDELEKTFRQLLAAPESFSPDDFDHLVDVTFKDRLSRGDIVELMELRLRNGHHEDPLEAKALLAIMDGNHDKVGHLFGVLDRRNSLGLRVISNEK